VTNDGSLLDKTTFVGYNMYEKLKVAQIFKERIL